MNSLPPSGFRYDSSPIVLKAAAFDAVLASYAPPAVHVLHPRALSADESDIAQGAAAGPNPYVDYVRHYTAGGGIELTYKSNDLTLWRILLRILIWLVLMGGGTWFMLARFAHADGCISLSACTFTDSQLQAGWAAFLLVGGFLIYLLSRPVHAIHTIEIRPDCLILDGEDVFWAAHMESRPTFAENEQGAQALQGIYGTRYMEFMALKPVDDKDATPAVLAFHIEDALKQLWDRPQAWAGG